MESWRSLGLGWSGIKINNYGGEGIVQIFRGRSVQIKQAVNCWQRVALGAFYTGFLSLNIAQVQAFQLTFDDPTLTGFVDTTVSASTAMRTESADKKGGTSMSSGNQTVFPDAGDIYSSPLSALTDIGFTKNNYSFFTRLSYIYDYTILNQDCSNCERPTPAPSVAGLASGVDLPNGISDQAQTTAGNKFRVLDLYVLGSWDISNHPLNVKVGKQVVNWGESDIIAGGISQMQNPVDLAKTTTPGTEVRETLMPQEMVYGAFSVSENVSLEAYYVWNWRKSVFIPVGTFFSPTDLFGDGYNPDLIPGVAFAGSDKQPDGGQWGVALHNIIESWHGADLGIYWVRSHAFAPYINYDPTSMAGPKGGYKWVYAQDQDTFAISLNGIVPGTDLAFQTELNYRPNFYDTRQCQNFFGLAGGPIPGCDIENSDVFTYLGALTYATGTTLLDADNLSLVFNINAEWVGDLNKGDPTDPVRPSFRGVSAMDAPVTDFSWGYVAVAQLDYNNVFANINISPSVVFVHNVEGYAPGASGAFVENQRVLRAGVTFKYLSRTSLEFAYSHWLGTAGSSEDRDNVSAVLKYSF